MPVTSPLNQLEGEWGFLADDNQFESTLLRGVFKIEQWEVARLQCISTKNENNNSNVFNGVLSPVAVLLEEILAKLNLVWVLNLVMAKTMILACNCESGT
jgi:hypothetical protein